MGKARLFLFDYSRCGPANQFYRSKIDARVRGPAGKALKVEFLCDTGASLSWADELTFSTIFHDEYDKFESLLKPSGLNDANGNPLCGVKKQVVISICSNPNFTASEISPADEITFTEDVYFGKVAFNLLGQTAFQKIGGIFKNFPESKAGRKFGLFENLVSA